MCSFENSQDNSKFKTEKQVQSLQNAVWPYLGEPIKYTVFPPK